MSDHGTPRGRQEVTAAVLDAATELFAARGPAAVSIREVAARAGVNHGLVHRHFGSKAALVRGVLDRFLEDLRRPPPPAGEPVDAAGAFEVLAAREDYWRILARAVLDGEAAGVLAGPFPLVAGAVDAVRAAQAAGDVRDDVDARMIVATNLAAGLGWLLFEPFVAAATGLPRRNVRGTRRRFTEVWAALMERGLAPG